MTPITLRESGLLVVDAQQGFSTLCPDELPVPGALEIVPQINRLLEPRWARIDASQDWHPPHHRSFHGGQDNLYPPHCIAGTRGAEFLPGLHTERFHVIWRKAFHHDFEAYAVTAQYPAFGTLLRASGIENVVVCGIATNICCFYAARDLRREGFNVFMVEDASAGLDVPAANLYQDRAKAEGQEMGIRYVTTTAILTAAAGRKKPALARANKRRRQ
jgi:nicotinamidase/pyrazinamidase